MANLTDHIGKPIELGQTLLSKDGEAGTTPDHHFTVRAYNWEDSQPEGYDTIADGGFMKILLTPSIAKRFKVVE